MIIMNKKLKIMETLEKAFKQADSTTLTTDDMTNVNYIRPNNDPVPSINFYKTEIMFFYKMKREGVSESVLEAIHSRLSMFNEEQLKNIHSQLLINELLR